MPPNTCGCQGVLITGCGGCPNGGIIQAKYQISFPSSVGGPDICCTGEYGVSGRTVVLENQGGCFYTGKRPGVGDGCLIRLTVFPGGTSDMMMFSGLGGRYQKTGWNCTGSNVMTWVMGARCSGWPAELTLVPA